ncbi:putative membrane protein [Methylovorus glucosotrophus]|nr:putative membrane protein [Methylovorus glucosotrophus]
MALLVLSMAAMPCFAAALSMQDEMFLKNAVKASVMEMEFNRLAVVHSKTPAVKEYAQRVLKDNEKCGDKLKRMALKLELELQEEPSLVEKLRLHLMSAKNGKPFDLAFIEDIGVEAHQDEVELFERAAAKVENPELKAFAAQNLPMLKQHLEAGKRLEISLKEPPH